MGAVARQMAIFDGAAGHVVQSDHLEVRRDVVLVARRVGVCVIVCGVASLHSHNVMFEFDNAKLHFAKTSTPAFRGKGFRLRSTSLFYFTRTTDTLLCLS